jgi:hypothetical protein
MQRQRLLSANVAVALVAVARLAIAQSPASAAQAPAPNEAPASPPAPQLGPAESPAPADASTQAPPASELSAEPASTRAALPRLGFQIALRTGYALPAGSLVSNGSMSDSFSGQLPVLVEAGVKSTDAIFVGGYFGLAFGSIGGGFSAGCSAPEEDCSTTSVRGGFEILGYFSPGERIDPWIGYGIGLESSTINLSGPVGKASLSYWGPEFAHLTAGLDYRLDRMWGLGVFFDLSVAMYVRSGFEGPTTTSSSNDVGAKALHEWATIGVRGAMFP